MVAICHFEVDRNWFVIIFEPQGSLFTHEPNVMQLSATAMHPRNEIPNAGQWRLISTSGSSIDRLAASDGRAGKT